MTTQMVGYKAKAFEPRNLVFFFLIAFGWTWFWWGLFIFGILKLPSGIGTSEVDLGSASPTVLIVLLAPYGPTLTGFVMMAITEGRTGVKALWKRFWNRDLSIKWLVVILLFFPTMRLIANIVSRTVDGQAYPLLAYPSFESIRMFVGSFIFDGFIHGGMSEEFGWRGYALPRFQFKMNSLASSIVLGAIWICWHIPLWFAPGDLQIRENFWGWAPIVLLYSVFYTWIFNNTNGSLLAAVLFHAMSNATPELIWCCTSYWHYIGVELLMAILIVIIFSPKNLVRRRSEEAK